MNESPKPEDGNKDSWRTQLVELNNRSRWYATQLWQVPFAYLGLTGVAVASAVERWRKGLPCVLFASAVFGLLVLKHFAGISDGVKRAVENIQRAEDELGLPRTAQHKPAESTEPLRRSLILAVVVYTVLGIWLLLK